MFRVIIQYGTWRTEKVYATTESYDDARKLRRTAIEHGYREARIVEVKDAADEP